MNREEEFDVIRRVLDGDVNAFEELVKAYETKVYNLALQMLGNKQDAQDVTQEAFIKAYNSPEEVLEKKLTRDAVRRGLASLPPDARQILLLREIEGLSYEEIGETLGLESGTVKSRLFRARKKLAAFLLKDGNIPDHFTSRR